MGRDGARVGTRGFARACPLWTGLSTSLSTNWGRQGLWGRGGDERRRRELSDRDSCVDLQVYS